jgi:hypothetical protein
MSTKELNLENQVDYKGPIESEYIRISDTKAVQLKIWGIRPSKHKEYSHYPAYVEVEEIKYPKDGEPSYGQSIRLSAVPQSFALAEYLLDFLKKARKINREARKT